MQQLLSDRYCTKKGRPNKTVNRLTITKQQENCEITWFGRSYPRVMAAKFMTVIGTVSPNNAISNLPLKFLPGPLRSTTTTLNQASSVTVYSPASPSETRQHAATMVSSTAAVFIVRSLPRSMHSQAIVKTKYRRLPEHKSLVKSPNYKALA